MFYTKSVPLIMIRQNAYGMFCCNINIKEVTVKLKNT